jgi:hypothetical protein
MYYYFLLYYILANAIKGEKLTAFSLWKDLPLKITEQLKNV